MRRGEAVRPSFKSTTPLPSTSIAFQRSTCVASMPMMERYAKYHERFPSAVVSFRNGFCCASALSGTPSVEGGSRSLPWHSAFHSSRERSSGSGESVPVGKIKVGNQVGNQVGSFLMAAAHRVPSSRRRPWPAQVAPPCRSGRRPGKRPWPPPASICENTGVTRKCRTQGAETPKRELKRVARVAALASAASAPRPLPQLAPGPEFGVDAPSPT